MKTRHPAYKYVFLWIDIAILTISFFIAITLSIPDFWSISKINLYFCFNHIAFCFLLIAVYIFSFRFNNLYKRKNLTVHYRQFILIIKALLGGTIVVIIFFIFACPAFTGQKLLFKHSGLSVTSIYPYG